MRKMAILVLKMVFKRLKSETPKFFKLARLFSIILAGIASLVVYMNDTEIIKVSESLSNICEYLIAFSISMGFTSQLASTDPSSIEEDLKK